MPRLIPAAMLTGLVNIAVFAAFRFFSSACTALIPHFKWVCRGCHSPEGGKSGKIGAKMAMITARSGNDGGKNGKGGNTGGNTGGKPNPQPPSLAEKGGKGDSLWRVESGCLMCVRTSQEERGYRAGR